jgi:hypothetical protein
MSFWNSKLRAGYRRERTRIWPARSYQHAMLVRRGRLSAVKRRCCVRAILGLESCHRLDMHHEIRCIESTWLNAHARGLKTYREYSVFTCLRSPEHKKSQGRGRGRSCWRTGCGTRSCITMVEGVSMQCRYGTIMSEDTRRRSRLE